jgi:hypothetical protein
VNSEAFHLQRLRQNTKLHTLSWQLLCNNISCIKEIPMLHTAEPQEAPAAEMKNKEDCQRVRRPLTRHIITAVDLHRRLSKNSTPTSARTMTCSTISTRRSSRRTVRTEMENRQLIWSVTSFGFARVGQFSSVAYKEAFIDPRGHSVSQCGNGRRRRYLIMHDHARKHRQLFRAGKFWGRRISVSFPIPVAGHSPSLSGFTVEEVG